MLFRSQNNILYIEETFEFLFTHDIRIATLSSKFKLVIPSMLPWIKNHKMPDKAKLVSMIASTKTLCPGHLYRQAVLEFYKDRMDCYGSGWNPIQTKEEGLNNYFFSICMENDNYANSITEKISDCLVTGTIPIYWGAPTIGEFFNEKGIILLDSDFKLEDLSEDLYFSKIEYIKENFERASQLQIAEDYIYLNYIK